MMMFGRSKAKRTEPDPHVNLHSIFASGGHDIDDVRGGHPLNADIISVCSSITGTLPYDGRSARRLNDYDNPGAARLPQDIIIGSRRSRTATTTSAAIEEVDSTKSGSGGQPQQQEGEAVVFKGWGGSSPAMNAQQHKKPASSPGWFGARKGATEPPPPETSPPHAAAEDALKELQAIGGIEIKCLDDASRRGSLPDQGEPALLANGGLDQPPMSQAELLQQMVEKKKQAEALAAEKASSSWFGRNKSRDFVSMDEGRRMEDLLRAPDLATTASQYSAVSERQASANRRSSTSWFGGSAGEEDSPVIPGAVREILLDTTSIGNVVSKFDSVGDLRTVEEDEPPPPPPTATTTRRMDASKIEIIKPVTRPSPISASRKVLSTGSRGYAAQDHLSDASSNLPPRSSPRSSASHTPSPASISTRKSPLTSPSPSVSSRRQSLTGAAIPSSTVNRKQATSRFDLSKSEPLAARADALRERIANRATRRDSSDHGGVESSAGGRPRRMSMHASKPAMASSGAYMSKQSSADGEKESHDTAPCTEDENSTPKSSTSSIGGGAGGAGAFLGGWGFMKNLGKEQVAEKSSSKTKKFKKSSFTPNAVNWREAPPKRRTQIASLKKTALISEDAKCQKRFRWGRDLLGEAFQPYRHMLCGSDDLLPDQDQFHAFAVDAEEADQGREAYVRTLMLQNGELSEREVAAFFEGLALFKVKNRALESQLVCVDAVRRFESEHSTVTTENEWESSIEGDNNVALRQVRRHMPVNIRSLTENQSVLQPSPTGKTLPKRFAKKFKQANVLQLIRMSPDDITKLHPASLENLRVQGLTLTERRALHAHLKVVGPVWKELNQREKDPLSERKYNWFVMMKQQFKEHLDSYTKHVEEYGPPGNHPYATRSNDKQGCPLIGKQCPLKADKLLDYSLDYGYPEGDIYEQVASATETDDTSVVDPKKEEAREKRAAERSEILSRHYQGKALKAALAVCACQEMDDAIDRLAKRQARWVKNQVINQHYDVTGDEWREIEACQAALKDIRHFVCKMVERAGLKLTFQTRVNARESLDTRSVMEIGLSEEVCDYSRDFLNNMESRFEMLGNGIGDLKIELTAVRALLKEIQDRNAGSLRNLGARRPKQTVLLKSRDELEAMVRKRMKAALQQSSTSASDGTSTFHESMESYPSYTVSLKGSSDGDSPRSRNTKMNMLAEFTSRMEVESVISGMTPVREEPVGATVQDETPAPVENTPLSRRSSLAPGGEKSPAAVNRRASLPGALKPADRENARTPPLVPTKSTPTGSTRSSPIISPRISPKQESKTTVSGSPRISPKQSTQTTVTTSAESSPKQEDKTAAVVSASSPRTSPSLTKRATPSSSPGVSPGQAKRATVRTSSDSEALKARVAALTAKKTARADATSTAAGNTAATRNSAPRQSMAELKASIAKRKEARAAAAAAAAATATGDEQ